MADTANGATPTKAQSGTMTKKEAVRQAVEKLGVEAPRQEIVDFVKKEFQIEISANHVSASRGDIRKEQANKGKAKAVTPKAAPKEAAAKTAPITKATAAQVTAPKAASPGNGKRSEGISLADIQALKDLLARNRAEELKALLDLLTK